MNRSLVMVLALLATLAISCEEKTKPPISTGLGGEIPGQESWNAKITFTDSGKVTATVRAGHISMYPERKYTLLDSNITVDFYDEHEYHTSTLTAKKGRVDDATHDFEAHGNVLVVSDSGSTLKTDNLFWANARKKIHTPDYVEIVSPKEQLQGQGFESDQDLRHYIIFRVTGQAKTNE